MKPARPVSRRRSYLETLENRLLLAAVPLAGGVAAECGCAEWNFGNGGPQEQGQEAIGTAAVETLRPSNEPAKGGVVPVGPLSAPRRFAGQVGRGDRMDAYRFSLSQDGRVQIDLTGLDQDVDIYLYDARLRQRHRSVRSGAGNESISVDLSAGKYLIAIVPYRGASSRYTLSLQAEPIPGAPLDNPFPLPETPVAPPTSVDPPAEQPAVPAEPAPAPLPDVPQFGTSRDWNLNAVGAPEAWARNFTGQGVVVAVIDTGVDRLHPELVDSIWQNAGEVAGDGIDNDRNGYADDVYGWNFAHRNNDTFDDHLHGTHVAGTIAAARNGAGTTGVAYGAKIMPIRVLGTDGRGSSLDVAAGIRYAVSNGADIINLSLGGGVSGQILSALQFAAQAGVLVVAAAGNEAAGTPSAPAIHSRELSNVISVAAHDRNGRRASFSNRVGGSSAVQIDAPGVGIWSTIPGRRYGTLSGTSMAAPHVAGVAALALSANPDLTAVALRQLLVEGALHTIAGSLSEGAVNAAETVGRSLV